jgi:transcription elongation GreA/GreB family factor
MLVGATMDFLLPALRPSHHIAMDKCALVEQLTSRIRESATVAQRAVVDATTAARDGATPAEKREDGRVALEYQSLAKGQFRRVERANAALDTLEGFRPPLFRVRDRITLGAIVEVEDGAAGRTFFLAPVGAGIELTGPGGDGFLSVVTPASPIGRAVLGRCVGDVVQVDVPGDVKEWRITFLS